LSTLPALTSRRTLCHWKSFNFLRQFRQRFRDGRRLAGAFVAEEVAVLQPDHLAGAEEGERLQPLAQSVERFERFGRCWSRPRQSPRDPLPPSFLRPLACSVVWRVSLTANSSSPQTSATGFGWPVASPAAADRKLV